VCALYVSECRVKEGLSRSEQLVGYFYSAPLLDVAYCQCSVQLLNIFNKK